MFSIFSHLASFFSEFLDLVLIGAGALLFLASFAAGPLSLAVPALAALGPVMGIAAKVARYAGLALVLVGGARLYVAREITAHDAARDAAAQLAIAQATAKANADAAEIIAQRSAEQMARIDQTSKVKTVILHDTSRPGCPASPALGTAFDELRRRAAGPGGSGSARRDGAVPGKASSN